MRNRLLGAAVLVGAFGAAVLLGNNYQLYVLSLVGLTAIAGVGLNILIGLAGQISLGHVAFYAIGAYSVGILTTGPKLSFWLALPIAGLISAASGALLAIPALRVRGPYLAMITIAFGFVVEQSLAEFSALTGGWNGLQGIPTPSLWGFSFNERHIACFVFAASILTFWLYARLSRSAWGMAFRAVRDSDVASQSIGLDPTMIRTAAFAMSAALAGMAGGVFASMSDFISPESFPLLQSILFLLAVMIGGSETVFGPLVGAIVVVLLPEMLSWLAQYRLLVVGILLLAVLRLAPEGIVGAVSKVWPRSRRANVEAPHDSVGRLVMEKRGNGQLDVQELKLQFGGVSALSGVTFQAASGRITSVIGPNGAGKSTVLNVICGFYAPATGSVRLDDRELAGMSSHEIARLGVARTYQTTQLFANMTVIDNVMIALRRGRLPIGALFRDDLDLAADAEAAALLSFVGYSGSHTAKAGTLSHVDRRLVEIARALAIKPNVLALDEPAAGLDFADKQRLGHLLRAIADQGVTVVLVEHDMKLVMSVSDHIVVLDAGRKIAEGAPRAIASNPRVLEAYLGHEATAPTPRRNAKVPGPVFLSTRHVYAGYAALPVIRDVSIDISEGELVAILGANGAGKSTLMKALSGLNKATRGEILFIGERIESYSADRITGRGLVLVPEGRQVFPELDVMDNLRLGAFSRPDEDMAPKLDRLLKRFPKLAERRNQRAGLLSGGEQQMLAIARGLMASPRVLLLDEPSLGLAPLLVGELYDLIAELREEGTTVLLVDQMATLALAIADRAYVLEAGAVTRAGTAADLAADPKLRDSYLGVAERAG